MTQYASVGIMTVGSMTHMFVNCDFNSCATEKRKMMNSCKMSYELVMLAALMLSAVTAQNINPPQALQLGLDIFRNGNTHLNLSCTFDKSLSNIQTPTSLSVLALTSDDPQNSFYQQLCSVDSWSQTPTLSPILARLKGSADGKIFTVLNKPSYLWASWELRLNRSALTYKCVVRGFDTTGKPVFESTNVTLPNSADDVGTARQIELLREDMRNLWNATNACRSDIDSMEKYYNGQLTDMQKHNDDQYAVLIKDNNIQTTHIQQLNDKITDLQKYHDDQMTAMQKHHNDQYAALYKEIHWYRKTAVIFDISEPFHDRVYLVSKITTTFNIGSANGLCRGAGGYLLVTDNAQEYSYVFNLVSKIGGTDHFMTGMNDIAHEGVFKSYNSGEAVPYIKWRAGEPNNAHHNEDCVELHVPKNGMNDIPCNYPNVKIVCEVPWPMYQ